MQVTGIIITFMPLYQDGPLFESDRSEHERLYAVIYDFQAGLRNENRGIKKYKKYKKYKLTDQQITLLDGSLKLFSLR